MRRVILAVVLVAAGLSGPVSRSDHSIPKRTSATGENLIEVGAKPPIGGGHWELVLAAQFGGFRVGGGIPHHTDPGGDSGHEPVYYIARIRADGEVGLGHDHDGDAGEHSHGAGDLLGSVRVQFVPVTIEELIAIGKYDFTLEFLNSEFSRDAGLGENWGVTVRLAGVSTELRFEHTKQLSTVVSVAADLLGFKVRDYVEGTQSRFLGAHLASLSAEVAEELSAGDFTFSLAVGANAGLDVGASSGFALAYEGSAYTEFRLRYHEFLELFLGVDVSAMGEWGGNASGAWSWGVTGGVRIKF